MRAICSLSLLSFVLLLVPSQTVVAARPAQDRLDNKSPLAVLQELNLLHSHEGMVKARIQAPILWQYKGDDMVYPQGIQVTFYNEAHEATSTLNAGYVHYFAKQNTYKLSKGVRIHNMVKQQTMTTEALDWDANKKEVTTDLPVQIATDELKLVGRGLFAKEDLSYYRILCPEGVLEESASKDADELPAYVRALPSSRSLPLYFEPGVPGPTIDELLKKEEELASQDTTGTPPVLPPKKEGPPLPSAPSEDAP